MNLRRFLPPVLWMGLIFGLSSIPGRDLPPSGIPHLDKLVHGCLYAILTALNDRSLRSLKGCPTPILAPLAAVSFGIFDEWHQTFVPGRSFEWLDILANTAGASVAAGVLFLRWPKPKSPARGVRSTGWSASF